MITVFSGTNRPDNLSRRVAQIYANMLTSRGIDNQLCDFEHLPELVQLTDMYGNFSQDFHNFVTQYVDKADKFIFIVPEYNGSYPGIVKVFIDTVNPSRWKGKKAALVGVASGRAGNLRGVDHLMAVLNYLRIEVYSQKPLLSSIERNLTNKEELSAEYERQLQDQITEFLTF